MFASLALSLAFAAAATAQAASSFEPPFIGVLGVDGAVSCDSLTVGSGGSVRSANGGMVSCFTTLYAKWLEQAGARVVGIPFDIDTATLDVLLSGLNGEDLPHARPWHALARVTPSHPAVPAQACSSRAATSTCG